MIESKEIENRKNKCSYTKQRLSNDVVSIKFLCFIQVSYIPASNNKLGSYQSELCP